MVTQRHVRFAPTLTIVLVCLGTTGLPLAQARAQPPAAPPPVQAPAPSTQKPAPPATPTPPSAKPASPASPGPQKPGTQKPAAATQELILPAGYVIGADDQLTVLYWENKEMSAEVTVRPDGVISLPLLNELQVAGLTPEQLREKVTKDAMAFLKEEPTVSVLVRTINSRKVHITGGVSKPGPYNLSGPTTVVQLIAMAGGIAEFSNSKNILIVRVVGGKQVPYKFNYKDFAKGKDLQKNIELRPGDMVVVP